MYDNNPNGENCCPERRLVSTIPFRGRHGLSDEATSK